MIKPGGVADCRAHLKEPVAGMEETKNPTRGCRAYLKEPVAGMEETKNLTRGCRAYLKEPVAGMEETKNPAIGVAELTYRGVCRGHRGDKESNQGLQSLPEGACSRHERTHPGVAKPT
jgi:hypothetical protein